MTNQKAHYRKDVLGDLSKQPSDQNHDNNPLIPAATVVLLRTGENGPEVLMLQKNTGIAFGGMWVFPGGRIDAADHEGADTLYQAALNAAIRETREETGLTLNSELFTWFAHWTPPPTTPKRFATWFFAVEYESHPEVTVDGGEILSHRWISPSEALRHHRDQKIELAPPTWITLYQLSLRDSVESIMARFRNSEPMHFETRLMLGKNGSPIALWHGDDAYDADDPDTGVRRHRLMMGKQGFQFENTEVDY